VLFSNQNEGKNIIDSFDKKKIDFWDKRIIMHNFSMYKLSKNQQKRSKYLKNTIFMIYSLDKLKL
jgi:hypothetical protein